MVRARSGPGRVLAAAAAALGAASPAAGAVVRVTDPGGRAVVRAEVACFDPVGERAVTSAEGVAILEHACVRARCSSERHVPVEVELAGAEAACTLREGAVLWLRMIGERCGAGCRARLLPLRGSGAAAAEAALRASPGPGEPLEVRLPPVAPGSYRLELSREDRSWSCSGGLGPLAPGQHRRSASWREPRGVAGRVVNGTDEPIPNMAVRGQQPNSGEFADWSCGGTEVVRTDGPLPPGDRSRAARARRRRRVGRPERPRGRRGARGARSRAGAAARSPGARAGSRAPRRGATGRLQGPPDPRIGRCVAARRHAYRFRARHLV